MTTTEIYHIESHRIIADNVDDGNNNALAGSLCNKYNILNASVIMMITLRCHSCHRHQSTRDRGDMSPQSLPPPKTESFGLTLPSML